MATVLLVVATIADLALAALLIAVSGFIFGTGPESTHAGSLAAVGYIAAILAVSWRQSPDLSSIAAVSQVSASGGLASGRRRAGHNGDPRALLGYSHKAVSPIFGSTIPMPG